MIPHQSPEIMENGCYCCYMYKTDSIEENGGINSFSSDIDNVDLPLVV
jgi:hypothetical protein